MEHPATQEDRGYRLIPGLDVILTATIVGVQGVSRRQDVRRHAGA
jgi:hypothetical protein